MTGKPRTSDGLRAGILILATMTTGLTAGYFVDWSNSIMPGLENVDDRTFVVTYQALDESITNPLFLGLLFTGSLLLIAVSAVLHRRTEQRRMLLWVAAALVLYLVAFVVTFAINEPLNQDIRAADGLESDAEFAAARALLDEAKWTAWNTVRAVASTAAFGCLVGTLVIRRGVNQLGNRHASA